MGSKNKELESLYNKKYYQEHKDRILKHKKEYMKENYKEHKQQYMQEYYKKHKEDEKQYRQEHKKQRSDNGKLRYKNNVLKIKEYYRQNKQSFFERVDKRRRNIDIVEHIDRKILAINFDNKCAYCEKDLGESYHIDHLIPVVRYEKIGKKCPHSYDNCAPSCPECNLSKHDKTPLEFMWQNSNEEKVLLTA
jgi:5-methylcytosine-specific restriction endonuclease McrA